MNVLFSGSSSIIASALIELYFGQGHTLFISEAGKETEEEIFRSLDDKIKNESLDLAFFLGSEEIFNASLGRKSLKKQIHLQNIHHQAVIHYLSSNSRPPKTAISTSSVLVYQNQNGNKSVENSPLSQQFPADYFLDVEQSALALEEHGTRVINLRLGKVVSKTAFPAFPRLPLLSSYSPVPLRKKSTIVSWVSSEDVLRAITYILDDTTISGPLNITSGDHLSLRDFHTSLTEIFSSEKLLPLPSPLVKLIFGQQAARLIDSDTRAIPFKLMDAGFFFEDISLQEYLQSGISNNL